MYICILYMYICIHAYIYIYIYVYYALHEYTRVWGYCTPQLASVFAVKAQARCAWHRVRVCRGRGLALRASKSFNRAGLLVMAEVIFLNQGFWKQALALANARGRSFPASALDLFSGLLLRCPLQLQHLLPFARSSRSRKCRRLWRSRRFRRLVELTVIGLLILWVLCQSMPSQSLR